jgi:DNA-directed RNA polymerase specialized sigma24 family protein
LTAKEYLNQARYLDLRINSKIAQIDHLNDLATHVTSTISDMPRNTSPDPSRMETTICKIVDLEQEISEDLGQLMDLKRDLQQVVDGVSRPEYQVILQKRYLEMEQWEDIAGDMNYDVRYVQKLHGRALADVQELLDAKRT